MGEFPEWAIDDPAIEGEMRLLRRVPKWLVHDGIIEKSNFREDEEGRGLSVTLWENPSDLDDLLRFQPDFGVICVAAHEFRAVGARIVRVPLVGNLNHCEIFPRFTPSPQKKLRSASKWVHYPSWVSEDHRGVLETF